MRLLNFRPLLAILALVATVALIASAADARPRSSFGSRGSQTFSAPPSTRTAPNAARPMERSMTQPGQPGSSASRTRDGTQCRRRPVRPSGLHGRPVRRLPRRRPARHAVRTRPHRRSRRRGFDARPAAADRHHRDRRLSAVDLVAAPQPAGAGERPDAAQLRPRQPRRFAVADGLRRPGKRLWRRECRCTGRACCRHRRSRPDARRLQQLRAASRRSSDRFRQGRPAARCART